MPWELRAVSLENGGSLGTVEDVQAKLRAAVPEIELFRDSGGADKLAAMESLGVEVPAFFRELWAGSPGAYRGEIVGEEFTIDLYLGTEDASVSEVGIEVRGRGDPFPVLRQLMGIEGWTVTDGAGVPPTAEAWNAFGAWRDDAVSRDRHAGE